MKNVNQYDRAAPEVDYSPFAPDMKVADLIEVDYKLLAVLPRLGINLGFGEASIESVCRRRGLSVDLFMLICRIYVSRDGFQPSCERLVSTDIDDVVAYLRASHSYYADEMLPRLSAKIDVLVASCPESHRAVLKRFFDDYCKEVARHFAYEEQVVFPYVHALVHGEPLGEKYSIAQFEDNHSDIDSALSDLKNIVVKYLPDGISSALRTDAAFDIFRLEEDLTKHTVVENDILIPLAEKLESDGR